jgi:hypothetical protein
MSASDAELLLLVASWRRKARILVREVEESGSAREIHRLVGMASSLDFAARELCHIARLDPNDGLVVPNAEADRALRETDVRLARDAEDSEP